MAALTILVITGAAFRYLGHALSWYDELASIGLVWLTYYGSALAALRGAHIGVPSLVNAMPVRARIIATLFAEAVVLVFFILLVIYGTKVLIVLQGEHMISLPSVPTPLTQSVIPIAAGLFVIAELLGLPDKLRAARTRRIRGHRAAGSARAHQRSRAACRNPRHKARAMTITLMLIGMVALALLNVPIAVALGAVAAAAIFLIQGPDMLPNMALVMFDGASSFPLLAIPLFILAGAIMNASSISRRLIALASALVGFFRGGLSMVSIGTSMFFAEISGSAVADVAALGTILIPAMKRRGYSKEVAAAVVSSSASLAIIIPPSIPMILYAVMAQTSTVKLFVAGILPGLIGALGLAIAAYWQAVRYDFPIEERFSIGRVWQTFKEAIWALVLPVVILGSIFAGIVTATEGAGSAVLAALVVGGLIYRDLDMRTLRKACIDGGVQTAVVMLLVAASALIGTFLTEAQMPQALGHAITQVTTNKYVVLLLLNVAFLILGMFLHSAAAIILVVPIVMPLVQAVGIDPIHFGLVVTLNLAIGQQTPPVASVLMTACAIAKSDIWATTRANLPFIAALALVLLLCTYVPWISLALVNLFYGGS